MKDFVNPDFGVQFENYLNFYHGMDIDPSKITHYADLTEEEKTTLESFVEQVKAYDFAKELQDGKEYVLPDDATILRFLQADSFQTDKALARLVATLQWQQEQNLPEKMSTVCDKLDTYRRIRVRSNMGRTKDGMPIFVERLGGFMNGTPTTEGKALTNDEWVHCFLYDLGELIREIRDSYDYTTVAHPDLPTTWKATWIMDCKGISVFKAYKALTVIKLLDSLTEPNFPEIAGPIFMINAPSLVTGVWKLCKGFLDPAVVAKIQIHSGVPKEALLEKMDESVLFEEYGGSNKKDFPKSDYV